MRFTCQIPAIPFLTEEEEDYLVEQYQIQGFRNSGFFCSRHITIPSDSSSQPFNFIHTA